ncbi:adenosylcobinamide-GDP ribazoletransferase [Herbaspirillum sp. RTI4]|uniref:adenosylcobinamide-GDP ribazoletransferase n=1 Tax=Herbaspirillum sp. RTI4 TaxID=3048640 RepID=UPI002AB44D7E|nr:adenosylcobinamide-GDP ribazoletransferase [Herbaspirillum sp. RTI4]MDY7579553.1 adenosylcobinamide-GDP ribazoletransferase [Herbaspirillum sp. RTI4]MEA9981818.1 adenosylcobinamide-GDP ribazoletransferase [Herbaspirillum sp. RTI4]
MIKIATSTVMYQLRLFFTALQFFTRLPVPRWVGFDPAWRSPSLAYFPIVGILVGGLTALAYALLLHIWPPVVAVLLASALGIVLTGALHEDGWADVCDGLGGSVSRERALDIMRDSRLGTYGVLGLLLLLALKCVTLMSLPLPQAVVGLFVAHPLSRLASMMLTARLPYARTEGKAHGMVQKMPPAAWMVAIVGGVLPLLLAGVGGGLSWPRIALMCIAVAGVTLWLMRLFRRRLGGYTGDCLGAVQQLTEVACYLCLLLNLPHY